MQPQASCKISYSKRTLPLRGLLTQHFVPLILNFITLNKQHLMCKSPYIFKTFNLNIAFIRMVLIGLKNTFLISTQE